MLEEFIRHKTEILGTIENVEFLTRDDMGAADNRLLMVKEQLIANCFNLVILGQFKRGKTTLINSLIGKEILPSSVVPLTSIVTILKYGEEVSCSVSMEDGSEKRICIEELTDYVTEKGNPKNIKGVRCARIGYPSPFLEKGILLIDTPGVGSTFLHNTETTYEFLDHLDAALFLMSADVPISQVEKELLGTIKGSTQKIFFVLNKIDNLTPKEIEEIAAFNKQVLEEMGFTVQETCNRFTRRSNNIINEFKAAAEILFEVCMEQYEFSVELARDTGFYYMVQEYTVPTEEEVKSILRTFLPKSMSRKMILNEMMEWVSSDVSRNCGRTRSELTARIRKTIDHYSKQMKDLGSDLVAKIEQAVQKGQERRRAGSESVRLALEVLANRTKTLEEHKENLEKVWNTINLRDAKTERIKVTMM